MKKEARGESDWEKGIMQMQTQVKWSSQIALIGFKKPLLVFFHHQFTNPSKYARK